MNMLRATSQYYYCYMASNNCITVLFIYMWCENLKSGYKAEPFKSWKRNNSFGKDVKDLFDKNLHKTLMFLPLMGIFVFTVLPLLFMIPWPLQIIR